MRYRRSRYYSGYGGIRFSRDIDELIRKVKHFDDEVYRIRQEVNKIESRDYEGMRNKSWQNLVKARSVLADAEEYFGDCIECLKRDKAVLKNG